MFVMRSRPSPSTSCVMTAKSCSSNSAIRAAQSAGSGFLRKYSFVDNLLLYYLIFFIFIILSFSHLSCILYHLSSIINHQSSIFNHQSTTINHQSSTSTINHRHQPVSEYTGLLRFPRTGTHRTDSHIALQGMPPVRHLRCLPERLQVIYHEHKPLLGMRARSMRRLRAGTETKGVPLFTD